MTLRQRLYGLILFPSLALILAVGFIVSQLADLDRRARQIVDSAAIFEKTSGLIHSLQLERGKSNLYASGKISADALNQARTESNANLQIWKERAWGGAKGASVGAPAEATTDATSLEDDLKVARSKVDLKNPQSTAEASKEYTGFISALIESEEKLAKQNRLDGLEPTMTTLVTFEFAKENAGRFRAMLVKVIGRDSFLGEQEVNDFVTLHSRFSAILSQPHIDLIPEEISLLKSIQASADWIYLSSTYQNVLEKAKTGHYGLDSAKNFAAATSIIEQMANIHRVLLERLNKRAREAGDAARRDLMVVGVNTFLGLLLLGWVSMRVIRRVNHSMREIAKGLGQCSAEVHASAKDVRLSSQSLAEASAEQASALEQTAASLEEITAMIQKASENVKTVSLAADESREKAEDGRASIENLLEAIREMSDANQKIGEAANTSNNQLEHIVQMIQDINAKTKVIDEIVFQTKLLSFNASVEAARAGDQGKGFAVVASEVSNLATMSGQASREISTMLSDSLKKVEAIARESREGIESILEVGTDKIHLGMSAAEKSATIFSHVLEKVVHVAGLAREIATASAEQAAGVEEINKAMVQLDSVTQQNLTESEKTARSAEILNRESENLQQSAETLMRVIDGQKVQADKNESSGMNNDVPTLPIVSRRAA